MIKEGTKKEHMNKLLTCEGHLSALAIDQRGAMKKMMVVDGKEVSPKAIQEFKTLVSQELTLYASGILLDPEYGLPASKAKHQETGLLLAYEQTGYDTKVPGRLPDLLPEWSVTRLKEAGVDGVKFLLYYDIDEDPAINDQKHAFVERIGAECQGAGLPFFLELVSYDSNGIATDSLEYALLKPHKVNQMMALFSEERYGVDVLKVEVPVNMNYVAGCGSEVAYTKEEAQGHFVNQSQSTNLPYIFLSAGVTPQQFQATLYFAKEAGSTFNGVLCGRATWAEGVAVYINNGRDAAINWLQTKGRENIQELNQVIKETAKKIQ